MNKHLKELIGKREVLLGMGREAILSNEYCKADVIRQWIELMDVKMKSWGINETNKNHELNCLCEDCLISHVSNGCSYGQPSGPDDFNECCDCGE